MKALGTLVLLLGLVACGGGEGSDGGGSATDPSSAAPGDPGGDPSDDPSDEPTEEDPLVDLSATPVCDLVRQGIDAFNLGDLEGTIARFEEAVPLAEDLLDERPGRGSEIMLEAVRYYAELPAEDYVAASQTSPDFLRYKDFTLTACAYGSPPDGATDPAVPA